MLNHFRTLLRKRLDPRLGMPEIPPRCPLDQALWQADFIFVPQTSARRADKRWGK